jgi:response regulator RpfG family c-di-GMP phosphodiesterase
MRKILVVDDDESMRGLVRMRLSDTYEVIDSGEPEEAVGLALKHKPDAILMDLMMPKFSGFELCQSLHSLTYTSRIPIYVITGEASGKYQEHCQNLGATGFFEKPLDFNLLKTRLAEELDRSRPERRQYVRVRMRVDLVLRGTDANGKFFEQATATENVSAGGFLCHCTLDITKDAIVEVYMAGNQERFVGRARAVRKESPGAPWQSYGFQLLDKNSNWVLQV